MKLYASPPSPRAIKVLAALHLLELDAEIERVDLLAGEQKRPEFAALNPNCLMPVLDDDGFVLWESNAILQYLASKRRDRGLWPADPRQQADASRWQCWELAHWGPACGTLVYERVIKGLFGQGDPDPAAIARGEQDFQRYAEVLNGHLRDRAWLVGDGITVADLSVGAWMTCAALAQYPAAPYVEVARWYDALQALPAWQRATQTAPLPRAAVG